MIPIILLSYIGLAAAVPVHEPRIVGGSATTVDKYPFMANMQYHWLLAVWYQSCGGSLITTTAVLSAAHCYSGDLPSSWRVVLGTSYAAGEGQPHTVSKLIVHENYNRITLINDVAIVKLRSAACVSSNINVASIAGPSFELVDDAVVTAIGWGTLSSGGQSPKQLQHVDLNVINQEICAQRYAKLKEIPGFDSWPSITPGMLCLGILDVGGKDACQGDSGGPVAYNRSVLVGITSWGYGCGDPYYPGVNTRVSEYANWIFNKVEAL